MALSVSQDQVAHEIASALDDEYWIQKAKQWTQKERTLKAQIGDQEKELKRVKAQKQQMLIEHKKQLVQFKQEAKQLQRAVARLILKNQSLTADVELNILQNVLAKEQ